jgi:hypothetical protein
MNDHVWITSEEFALIMGRTRRWAQKYAKTGHFSNFGILVLMDESLRFEGRKMGRGRRGGSSGDRCRLYFLVPSSLL